ncbi:MAG: MFS transporter [Candidatus Ancillula sp.]|jgi:MFS family permease|nr:MFS transporter [Candidatus Ancillula sp.]
MRKINPNVVYLIGALGGLLFGIDSGLTGGVMSPAKHYLQLSAGQEVLMANVVTLGAGVIALFAGMLNDKFGRKKLLLAASVIFLVGAFWCSIASTAISLVLARFVLGAGIGIASAVVPAYLAELSPAAKRSGIATLFQFAIVLGLNIAYIVDYFALPRGKQGQWLGSVDASVKHLTGNDFFELVAPFHIKWMQWDFQIMFGFAIIPAIILLIAAFFMPESPRFLAKTGRIDECRTVLMNMRNNNKDVVDAEIAEIEAISKTEAVASAGGRGKLHELVTTGRKPLIAALGLAFFQQLVGINAAFYYGPVIAGSVIPHPFHDIKPGTEHWISNLQQDELYAIIFGVVNIVATLVTVIAMNKIKSYKSTLNLGAIIMCVFSVLFAIITSGHLLHKDGGFIPDVTAIILVCAYIIGFAFSWGPCMWNIIGEIFPLSIRGIGASIGAAANWFSNFVVMSVFGIIILKDSNGSATHVDFGFGLFAVGCLLAIAFTVFVVPETKGKSLEEIENGFIKEKGDSRDIIALVAEVAVLVVSTILMVILPYVAPENSSHSFLPVISWILIIVVAAGFSVPTIIGISKKKQKN